jgi:FlaA1/EpsC-like NDP-sugar epimerase
MEENPAQAILNNIIGTRNLVNLAVDYGVSYFVNISTDKAVNPTSVMGASKRISEQVVKWGALQANKGEIFVSVRFGNVLGSRGSVIPIFKDQIRSGGPVTVTHPDMIRYFMTIPEASQLVLQAAALKENGSIFVLDMGEPVNISDMAKDLIRLSGLEPEHDVKIEYTGIRPGEKMFEELLTAEEGTQMTKYDKVFVAKNGYAYDEKEFSVKLDELLTLALEGDETKIREKIYEMVPSFTGLAEEVD